MTEERGDAAHLMLTAALADKDFEDTGVPDTLHNRELYAKIQVEIEHREPGQVIDVPGDWARE